MIRGCSRTRRGDHRPHPNRHIAFGASEHRCLGSHLARAELRLAIEEWIRLIPEFQVDTRRAAAGQGRPGLAARAAARLAGHRRDPSMKPAPFEYHAPSTSPRRSPRSPSSATTPRSSPAARAWCRCSTCGSPASSTSSTSAGRRAARHRAAQRRSSIGAPRRRASSSTTPTVAADVPLLAGDAVHRPLPDPQPGHDRRLAGPRRPGRRVPGRRRRPRRRRSRSCRRGTPAHRRPASSSPATWSTALEADELLRPIAFPVWDRRTGFGVAEFARRHGDFAIAGAVGRPSSWTMRRVVVRRRRRRSAGRRRRCGRTAEAACSSADGAVGASDVGRIVARTSTTSPDDLQVRRPTAARVGADGRPTPGAARVPTPWTGTRHDRATIDVTRQRRGARAGRARKTLADFLREDSGSPGTHLGCEHGVCGACTVLVDGERRALVPDVRRPGRRRRRRHRRGPRRPTASSRRAAGVPREHGLQCGFCTPGLRRVDHRAARRNPDPDDDEIRDGLSGQPLPLHRLPGDHPGRPAAAAPRRRSDRTVTADRAAATAGNASSASGSSAARTPAC